MGVSQAEADLENASKKLKDVAWAWMVLTCGSTWMVIARYVKGQQIDDIG